jgi:hypothetical protein
VFVGFDHGTAACPGIGKGSIGGKVLKRLVSPVPVPTTMLLLVSGLIGLAGLRRKFMKR